MAQPSTSLRVIRTTPTGDANPMSTITVTFDRPVAGSLDRQIDPATIFHIQPEIAGKLEWRDPVTIRFTPRAPLTTGATYVVAIANGFHAMDGSALDAPVTFSFRVQWPRLLEGTPVDSANRPTQVHLDEVFQLAYSSAVDTALLSKAAYLEFDAACAPTRVIHLRASERRLTRNDRLQNAGGWRRDPSLDSLRRVVVLTAESPLPRACAGALVAPVEADSLSGKGYVRWPFQTYGDFRITKFDCERDQFCPTGPLYVHFTNPVRGADVLRHVHLSPAVSFRVADTSAAQNTWALDTVFARRTEYTVTVDTTIRDVYGQSLLGGNRFAFRTTSFAPGIEYPFGNLLVERVGFKTLSVHEVNVDTLIVSIAPIPDSLEARVLQRMAWSEDTVMAMLSTLAKEQRIATHGMRDRLGITTVHLDAPDARTPGSPTLFAIRVRGVANGADVDTRSPVALVQVTNLGVHVRLGAAEGTVWVTNVNTGAVMHGAAVTLYDQRGRQLATGKTDARGLARLMNWTLPPKARGDSALADDETPAEGYVRVTLGADRAVASFNAYDPDLSAWRFGVDEAWGPSRYPVAGTVFTERGIYRPGERVYAKTIVRDGVLGSLHPPAPGDSVMWRFHDRYGGFDEPGGIMKEFKTKLSSFGTADASIVVPAGAPIGVYLVETLVRRMGAWRTVGTKGYRVAEYRPPEFLVSMAGDSATHLPGDTIRERVSARYLFGAPMGRALLNWEARARALTPWELEIPGMDDWYVGGMAGWDWRHDDEMEFASGTDSLDARGERALPVSIAKLPVPGRPAQVTIQGEVMDINRQTVGVRMTTIVHPAEFYIAAQPLGKNYFWTAGTPQSVAVLAVRPSGDTISGVSVSGTVVRREWHRVNRERDGIPEVVGDWVYDTVATCSMVTARTPSRCDFTPTAGGSYDVNFTAADRAGRPVFTSFSRWATGSDWVPWDDESQFKMDVIADKTRYTVGDTATIMFASPFTNAQAWITVEREGIIEQRRVKLTSGSTTLKFPITEAFAPNAFISILVARGRSAAPQRLDDPGRPTIRVGYTSLRVTPEAKRLSLTVRPARSEYRPGDTATVQLTVKDRGGSGRRAEVTLWAVDEGVLSLTGYTTPDPIDLIYRERGLGMRLRSNLTTVAPQVPEGTKGSREPGGGGGSAGADVLRSRFQTTAFFLGSVVTDAKGNASATAALPDNLTTFRLMAVAVTAGDRYGKGESELLVTRPLLARQALPRFIRPGDQFTAGAVINRRDGAAETVAVHAAVTGAELGAPADQTATLEPMRGVEVRYPFTGSRTDAATFRFDVAGAHDTDAVRVTLPVKSDMPTRARTIAGVLHDSGSVTFSLPADVDPERSKITLGLGASPLAVIRGMDHRLRVYPYDCTEQVSSAAMALIPLYRAQRETGLSIVGPGAAAEIQAAVTVLSRRQRQDGGIGYWSSDDWSSAWLTSYAGLVLLDARDAGVPVDTLVLSRIASYLHAQLHPAVTANGPITVTPISVWLDSRRIRLGDQVAAVDFLSRLGRFDVPAENELVRTAAQMSLEDRARLAEVLTRRRQMTTARQLMAPTWAQIRVDGRRAVLPDSLGTPLYFTSEVRPLARIITATLAVDSTSQLVGPLVETLTQLTRPGRTTWLWNWNTQDFGSAVSALAAVDRAFRAQPARTVRLRSGGRTIIAATRANRAGRDSTVSLAGLVAASATPQELRFDIDAGAGTASVYYYLTLTEMTAHTPTTPDDNGIQVERWYERYADGAPITSAVEGELVRVRLRLTVPSARQFVVLDDALPAGLEAVDLSLRTASALPGPGAHSDADEPMREQREGSGQLVNWMYGSWDSGWWSPFDHREIRDDRVVYSATVLFPGSYTATYVARATTPGIFIRPPAHAEEMYNPAVNGRTEGGIFTVARKAR